MIDGHAYNKKELRDIRKELRLDQADISDLELMRHLDEFAFLVGLRARTIGDKTFGERAKQFEKNFVGPLNQVSRELKKRNLQQEFWNPDSCFTLEDVEKLTKTVHEFEAKAEAHLEELMEKSKSKKRSRTKLNSHIVEMAEMFAHYLNPKLKPGRSSGPGGSWFQAFVTHLSGPVLNVDGKENGLDAAVRRFVGKYNKFKRDS